MGTNAAPQPARSLPPHIISHVNDVPFQAPPNAPDKTKWLEDIKQRYAKALFTMENARNATKSIEQTLADNQSLSPDDRKKLEERKVQLQKQYTDAISFANAVRKQYASGGNQKPAQNGAAAPNAATQARPQTSGAQTVAQPGQGAGNGVATSVPTNPMQSSTAAVNAAIEAAKNQQMAAGRVAGAGNALPVQQGPPARPHPPQIHAPGTPAQAQPSPTIQAPQAQPATQTQQPQPSQQSQQSQQPQPPIKIEPGTQPLPTLNTALAATVGGMQSVGTPTQNSARLHTPQSATPTTANANIRPLTHAAAINLASQQRPGGPAGTPTTGPGNTPAPALGVIGSGQQQGHSHAHPPQPTVPAPPPHSKLPIPKVLHEKATQMPTPVPNIGGIGSGRPTYSAGGGMGGGVMNQPALPKTPAYQLEGEGERILNKKKLDELVRQVCGGTAEGQEGNMLTPEVEEVSFLFIACFFFFFC
jgi:transcription initiation factor TFIID subunit 12